MILQDDYIIVKIGSTLIRSHPYQNPQLVFDPEAIDGWYDGVVSKRTDTVRPNQWGDFSEPGLLGSRHLSLTGSALADSPKALHDLRDKFMGLLIDGEYTMIEVQNSSGSRFMSVTLDGTPNWKQKLDNVALWKLDLYAPDPRMYGAQKTAQITDSTSTGGLDFPLSYPLDFGGAITTEATVLYNGGNAESWPVFKVTGDYFSGFTLTDGYSKKITFDGVVTRSAPVTIDTGAGTAIQGGVDKSNLLSRRSWFSIPPGGSLRPRFLPIQDGFGWCDIMYRDTWI